MATKNLWGELPSAEGIRTPVSLLREQASILGEKTNKFLEGTVSLRQQFESYDIDRTHPKLAATLSIVVPSLDGYQVTILEATYELHLEVVYGHK